MKDYFEKTRSNYIGNLLELENEVTNEIFRDFTSVLKSFKKVPIPSAPENLSFQDSDEVF